MSEHKIPIPSRVYNAAVGGHVAGADQIIDDKTCLTLDKVAGGALEEKEYTSGSNNGMGRVVLRKNIVEGVNTLTQNMINKNNTIYVIQYDFILGEDIIIPENCVLEFNGGSVSGNNTLIGNNTYINAGICKIFNLDINFKGSFNIKNPYCEWFGGHVNGTEQEIYIQKCLSAFNNVLLLSGNYYISYPIILTSYQSIKGVGCGALYSTQIHKSTNTKASNIPITVGNVDLNQDAIIIIVPKADDPSGYNQYNYVYIDNLCIYGDSKNEYGILASDGRYAYYTNLFIFSCRNGIRAEYSWMQTFTNVRMNTTYSSTIPFEESCGFKINELAPNSGYTTIKFRDCYVQAFHIGYKLHNCTYGIFDNCACDGCIDTSYYLYNNHGIVINSNGTEHIKLSDKDYSAAYYISNTEIILNGCYSTYVGINSESDNKYLYKIVDNSKVTLNSCIHANDDGLKIKVSWYSMLFFNGDRTVIDNDNSIFELSDGSSVVWLYEGNLRRLTERDDAAIDLSTIVTSNDFKNKIPEANVTQPGLMPAGFIPADSRPHTISDANDLKNGTYYVSGNLANLPDNRWGVITSCRTPSGNGYQIFTCFSTDITYYRNYGSSWIDWRIINMYNKDFKFSGIFNDKPNSPSIGFAYFCTDRQTVEGATNGIMIYYKGNDIWVDALGRIVS